MTIYQNRNYGGWYQCIAFYSNECLNLNSWWYDRVYGGRVSSVNTHDTCVRLYDRKGCEGNYVEVEPGSKGLANLNLISFEDYTGSVSSCIRNTTATLRKSSLFTLLCINFE